MTNSKTTKRALVSSAVAIVLCLAMLIGSTFAWFTDTASTGVNKIQAGNLKMEVSYKNADTRGEFAQVSKETPVLNDSALWEPGHVEYAVLNVKNVGTLALKYKLGINIASETGSKNVNGDEFKLSDYIKFAVIDGEANVTDRAALVTAAETAGSQLIKNGTSKESHLDTQGASETVTLVVWMPETVGNEANHAIDAAAPEIMLGINVYATQYTLERDSFDDQYDANAQYTEIIANGRVFNGGRHTLNGGITATEPDAVAVKAINNADVTIEGGAFDGGANGNNVCVFAGSGATVTIKDGTFTVGGDANGYGNSVIETNGGTVIIEGGFFKTDYQYGGRYYVLNQNNGTPGTIVVKGGTFVNYDPSTGDDHLGGNFVADGYSVISETKSNGDVWYTVVEGNAVTLTPDTVNNPGIYHSNGTYFLSAGDYGEFTATLEQSYKNVTFLASENAKFDEVTIRYHGGTPTAEVISAKDDSTLTVKGFHVSGGISINSFDKNVIVAENDAASITLKTNHVADMNVRFLNNELGAGTVSNGYGIYFVPNTTNYDLTITGNAFTGTSSHAIAVQGNGDGAAVTAAKSITVKDNAFNSYGLNGKTGRAAFKIWADTNLAPADKADLTASATALADSVKANNTFASNLNDNCVVADFYGTTVAFN